jgi:hypothetical protein
MPELTPEPDSTGGENKKIHYNIRALNSLFNFSQINRTNFNKIFLF